MDCITPKYRSSLQQVFLLAALLSTIFLEVVHAGALTSCIRDPENNQWAVERADGFPKVADMVADIQTCGIVSQSTSLFWSYHASSRRAAAWGKAVLPSSVTVNDAMDDSWWSSLGKFKIDNSNARIQAFQKRLSQAFAIAASGTVYVIVPDGSNALSVPDYESHYYNFELPKLQRSGRVQSIMTVIQDSDPDLKKWTTFESWNKNNPGQFAPDGEEHDADNIPIPEIVYPVPQVPAGFCPRDNSSTNPACVNLPIPNDGSSMTVSRTSQTSTPPPSTCHLEIEQATQSAATDNTGDTAAVELYDNTNRVVNSVPAHDVDPPFNVTGPHNLNVQIGMWEKTGELQFLAPGEPGGWDSSMADQSQLPYCIADVFHAATSPQDPEHVNPGDDNGTETRNMTCFFHCEN